MKVILFVFTIIFSAISLILLPFWISAFNYEYNNDSYESKCKLPNGLEFVYSSSDFYYNRQDSLRGLVLQSDFKPIVYSDIYLPVADTKIKNLKEYTIYKNEVVFKFLDSNKEERLFAISKSNAIREMPNLALFEKLDWISFSDVEGYLEYKNSFFYVFYKQFLVLALLLLIINVCLIWYSVRIFRKSITA